MSESVRRRLHWRVPFLSFENDPVSVALVDQGPDIDPGTSVP